MQTNQPGEVWSPHLEEEDKLLIDKWLCSLRLEDPVGPIEGVVEVSTLLLNKNILHYDLDSSMRVKGELAAERMNLHTDTARRHIHLRDICKTENTTTIRSSTNHIKPRETLASN